MNPYDNPQHYNLRFLRRLPRHHAIEVYKPSPSTRLAEWLIVLFCIGVGVAALFGSFPAHGADGWAAIAESTDGDRWLVNVPSVSIYKNDVGTWVVTGEMRNLRAGDLHNAHQFFVGVPIKACAENSGVVRVCGIKCTEFYWQQGGTKVYDGLAYWLCYTAKAKSKAEARKRK